MNSEAPIPTPAETGVQKPIIDMTLTLGKIPPIKGVFSPNEEVQKLWSVTKSERREAVSTFKDKLARQREAWALCRTSIEDRIESDPDLPREEMVGIVREFAPHYGFTESHIGVAESLIDDYIKMHKKALEIREKFPDDIDLLKRLTGMKFTKSDMEDFTVVAGPMSIEITCSGLNAGKIYEKSKDTVPRFEYSGFASVSRGEEPVYYLVVNKDMLTNSEMFASTVIHEREHQKNRILEPRIYGVAEVRSDVLEQLNSGLLGFLRHQVGERLLGFERKFRSEILDRYVFTSNPEKKAFLLEEYMRLKREVALNQAKDEIIAMLKVDIPHIRRHGYSRYAEYSRIFFEQKDGSNDYLSYLRNFDKKKDASLWQETVKRVLVDEYRDIFNRANVAFNHLVKSGYTESEAIAMLSDKQLAQWPKTVRRLLEAKEQRE